MRLTFPTAGLFARGHYRHDGLVNLSPTEQRRLAYRLSLGSAGNSALALDERMPSYTSKTWKALRKSKSQSSDREDMTES